jgi:hypothetical protein
LRGHLQISRQFHRLPPVIERSILA